jgi:hypothetical protein
MHTKYKAILILTLIAAAVIGWRYLTAPPVQPVVFYPKDPKPFPTSTSESLPTSTPVSIGKQAIEEKPKTPLAKLEITGGRCVYGECKAEMVIFTDATFTKQDGLQEGPNGKVSTAAVSDIRQGIIAANFIEIRKNKFTGVCPKAYDDSEYVYTFYADSGEEVVRSCEHQIDLTADPFKTVWDIYWKTKQPVF